MQKSSMLASLQQRLAERELEIGALSNVIAKQGRSHGDYRGLDQTRSLGNGLGRGVCFSSRRPSLRSPINYWGGRWQVEL